MTGRLDPDAQGLLEVMEAMGAPALQTLSVEAARERMRAAFIDRGEPLALHEVRDVQVPSPAGALRCRLYRPAAGELPMALFLHGGGWTVHDLDTTDRLCRRIAKRSGWLVASLDYRRSPEHRYPAALLDSYVAYRWLLDNAPTLGGDAARCAVVGESSGGSLAAGLTLMLRDLGAPAPVFQALAYPVTDRFDGRPSHRERGTGYALDREQMRWYLNHYLPAECDVNDHYLWPLTAESHADLPPMLMMTAEFDPVRDDGIAYAERLAASGVEVEHLHCDDQMHGFLMMDRAVRKAGELIDHLGDALAARA